MTVWKRLLITIVAMMAASLIVGLLWRAMFDARMPGYLSGLIGGMAALGLWEFLRSEK